MDIIKIVLCVMFLAILCVVVRSYKSEYALLFELFCLIMIGYIVVSKCDDLIENFESIILLSDESFSSLKILLKALSISVLCDFASSFCRESGNETLSKGIELIGKTAILSLGFPLLKLLVETAIGFIG